MKNLKSTCTGLACALTLAIGASPAVAGHKYGGYYKHGGYGMTYNKARPMYQRPAHPYCQGRAMASGQGYAMPGHHGFRPMQRGYQKHSKPNHRYGYGGNMAGSYGGAKSAKHSAYGSGYGHGAGKQYGKPAGGKTADVSSGYANAANAGATTPAQKDIVGVAAAAGNFSTLISAVKAAGLADTLTGEGPFTVLAPSDEAFNELPKDQVAGLMSDTDALKNVLTYHVIAGQLSAADLLEKGEATTVNGAKVSVAQLDVAKADVMASNGVIHVINKVLIPAE